MFESFFGINQPEKNNEEKLLGKQLDAASKQAAFDAATDPQADLTYMQQQQEREDLVRWQQDLEPEIRKLQSKLRREWFDEDGVKHKMKDEKGNLLPPMCNEELIEDISTDLDPLTNKNMIMSNFQEERILKFLKRTTAKFIIKAGIYHEKYAIAYHNISPIINLYKLYIMPAPFRALNNGERRHLDTINRRIESYSEGQQPPKKKGLFAFGG